MTDKKDIFQTICIHEGEDYERFYGGVTPPIFENSLFSFPAYEEIDKAFAGNSNRYIYTRGTNPTVEILERKITALEGTEATKVFASGMAAISAAIMSVVKNGDHVVAVKNIYSPAYQFLTDYLAKKFAIDVTYVDGRETDEIANALKPNTSLIYLESPTSLNFHLQDIRAVAQLAKEQNIITIIDNSYSTPYYQRPFEMGVDLIVHSATKYLNGHSDVVAGVVTGRKDLIEKIQENELSLFGGIIGPFEAWLIIRGLRTLGIRMERHTKSALKVANFLEQHLKVKKVNYPGLESFPQKELADRQMSGWGGLLSIEVEGDIEGISRMMNHLKYFSIGVSWGGFESLVFHPYISLKHKFTLEEMAEWDLSPQLIRLFIGLEDPAVLIQDLAEALEQL
ncbi:hypothetical protein BBF96_12630 [Anoxybacter fermentans]|uniref:homocysteine desulfhydrase n=1 Tax=Anoxybacter fermentans TaxID=1323375 RepID=A0A3Q9HRL1_9FIRM|nr:PLP-dependent aspartate aminotransferase family protein [Anoxybacter fermentans]AZR74166.1 hypothetical protein BBF96_12630 [Anoxybacter fermentans]